MSTLKTKLEYRGFYITEEKYKLDVDNFYDSIQLDDDELYVLKAFWKKNSPRIDLPYMDLDNMEDLLFSLIENDTYWDKFNKIIERDIAINEQILVEPNIQEQISNGNYFITKKIFEEAELCINLNPLLEFSYWIKLLNILFIGVIRQLLEKYKITDDTLEKALIIKRLITVSIKCSQLIKNKYAYNDLSYYYTNIEKIVTFFQQGLEVSLYSFAILFPNLVCEHIHPIINRSSILYKHPILEISLIDPIYGETKKKYSKFY